MKTMNETVSFGSPLKIVLFGPGEELILTRRKKLMYVVANIASSNYHLKTFISSEAFIEMSADVFVCIS